MGLSVPVQTTMWIVPRRPYRFLLSGVFCAVLAVAILGCERSRRQQTSQFREAEKHFVRGEYEAALDDYQAFLERYPRHRLADTARLRIRSLNREVQAVMDRENMPAPRHVSESPESGGAQGNESPRSEEPAGEESE